MATFSKKKLLAAAPNQIVQIADSIRREFESDGFEVNVEELYSGGCDISITKGSIFKAVLGMKSALKVKLIPQNDGVLFDAGVGIFGQQAIPTVISMFIFWPVLLTQIWGLVQQSSMDDRALAAAERALSVNASRTSNAYSSVSATDAGVHDTFCPFCGKPVPTEAKFCPFCGKQI